MFKKKLQRSEVTKDLTLDSFKRFMEWFYSDYCGHFEELDPLFEQRKVYI